MLIKSHHNFLAELVIYSSSGLKKVEAVWVYITIIGVHQRNGLVPKNVQIHKEQKRPS